MAVAAGGVRDGSSLPVVCVMAVAAGGVRDGGRCRWCA